MPGRGAASIHDSVVLDIPVHTRLHLAAMRMTGDWRAGLQIVGSKGTIIRGLQVKDYPILLRLSPIRYVFLPTVFKTYPR